MAEKSLDIKLKEIHANPQCNAFILADAKDADMAGGIASPGKSPEHHAHEARFRTLGQYRQLMRDNIKQGLIDIMLMSASSNEVLTINQRLFDGSHITPAVRANDTTDIHLATGSVYATEPSQPFRTATIDHMMCGKVTCEPNERSGGADLGLYSMTFNNDLELDRQTLDAYSAFRVEAERKGFRHFLEIFNPNSCGDHCPADIPRFINDIVARTLAGVTDKGRPVFLKIPYHGPKAMEQLVSYDPHLVVGILGGSSGTTYDAFFQLWEAKKYGAKAALYGRMINNSEHQPSFIQHLRWLADGELNDPAQAVRSYHGMLEKQGLKAYRSLRDDLVSSTSRLSSYGQSSSAVAVNGIKHQNQQAQAASSQAKTPTCTGDKAHCHCGCTQSSDDFDKMTPAQKVQWNLKRWDDVLK